MTRHHTRLTFEETKKYVDHCIGLETFTPDIDTKTGNPTADSLTKSRQILMIRHWMILPTFGV